MLIYRYQDANGIGPYQHPVVSRGLNQRHATPQAQGIAWVHEVSCSAFSSVESADRWFSDYEVDLMEEYGFELHCFEIHRQYVQSSDTQLVVNRHQMVFVRLV